MQRDVRDRQRSPCTGYGYSGSSRYRESLTVSSRHFLLETAEDGRTAPASVRRKRATTDRASFFADVGRQGAQGAPLPRHPSDTYEPQERYPERRFLQRANPTASSRGALASEGGIRVWVERERGGGYGHWACESAPGAANRPSLELDRLSSSPKNGNVS